MQYKIYLGRDTTDVEASPAEGTTFLDTGGLEPKLSRLDGGDVAAGTTSDHHDVVVLRSRRGGETP